MKNLNNSKSMTKWRPQGESPSHPSRPSRLSSFNKRVSQGKINAARESNEGYSRGGDGEDPP